MRNIEIKSGINTDTTRIFVDGIRLEVFFDNKHVQLFNRSRSKLPPSVGNDLIRTMGKRLQNDVVNLTPVEVDFIIGKFKEVLGL